MKVKEESEKAGLKLNIQKIKLMAYCPITSWQVEGNQWETFFPNSKHLLISWLQLPSAVILEPPKINSDTVSPSICHEVMGPDAMIFIF